MTGNKKSISNLDIENRKSELSNINTLFDAFGNNAYRAIEKQYAGSGYEAGMERLTRLIKENKFSPEEFQKNPVKGVEEFLRGFFVDRGGSLPAVWSEHDTVFLMTEINVSCITINAEKQVKVGHRDVCNMFCRAYAKGMVKIFEDLFPGVLINFYNASSKRRGQDCVEGFQVVYP